MEDVALGSGLRFCIDDEGDVRMGVGDGSDWLGPGRVATGPVPDDAVDLVHDVIDDDVLVLRLRARRSVEPATSGGFADVGVGLRFDPRARTEGGHPTGLRAFGHQYTEFGLPTQAGADLDRWFLLPFRPNVVLPLWLCDPAGPTLLLAPIDSFHEQVLTVPAGDASDDTAITWGWHGDLDEVPAGFTTSLAVLAGDSPRGLLERWAGLLDIAPRPDHDADTLGRSVSYWTDNGAAYWYRTEPRVGPEPGSTRPRTVTETLVDAVASVEAAGVPIGAVQLDSWFYPHEVIRPFDTDEWTVPPTGLVDWAPRNDILPDGFAPLRAGVGDRPLVTHCRHLSRTSPLVERFACWIDEDDAHPEGDDYYRFLLDRARSWGVETFEHDWLVECFLGVRGLRAAPGRARLAGGHRSGCGRAEHDAAMVHGHTSRLLPDRDPVAGHVDPDIG